MAERNAYEKILSEEQNWGGKSFHHSNMENVLLRLVGQPAAWLLLQWSSGFHIQTLTFVSTPRQYPFQRGRRTLHKFTNLIYKARMLICSSIFKF